MCQSFHPITSPLPPSLLPFTANYKQRHRKIQGGTLKSNSQLLGKGRKGIFFEGEWTERPPTDLRVTDCGSN